MFELEFIEKKVNDYQSLHMPDSPEVVKSGYDGEWQVKSFTFNHSNLNLKVEFYSTHGGPNYYYKPREFTKPWHYKGLEVRPSPDSKIVLDYSIPHIKLTSNASTLFAAGYHPTYSSTTKSGGNDLKPLTARKLHGMKINMSWKQQEAYLNTTFGRTIKVSDNKRIRTEFGSSYINPRTGKSPHHTNPVHLYGYGTAKFQRGFDEAVISGYLDELLEGDL